jgi:hypothetical protein
MTRFPTMTPPSTVQSQPRRWRLALLLIGAVFVALPTVHPDAAPLPEMGDPSAAVLTPAAEPSR